MSMKETSDLEDRNSKEIRRRQLAEVLSHQGKIELDIDLEGLAKLRSMSVDSGS